MALRLGIPDHLAGAPLPRRLAWLTAARLFFLVTFLALTSQFYLRGKFSIGSFTVSVASITLTTALALAAVYAALLRRGRALEHVAHAQLVLDQLTWTVVVYLSGGAASGATSLYGLSCLVGAILTGMRGAALAAAAGWVSYVVLLVLLETGTVEPPPDQPALLYQLGTDEAVYYTLVNLLVIIVVTLLAGYLAERLRLTGGQLVRAEQRAEQAEQLAVLGKLAAGLAHEIRNPLGSIAGSIQLLRHSPTLSGEERQLCDIVQREAARLNDLVTDMLDLSRPRAPEVRPINVVGVVREVVALAAKSGRAGTDVEVTYVGPNRAVISADESQFRQLVWNLVRNAVQASRAGEAVEVRLDASAAHLWLNVVDHGIGIDEAARAKIFDAFFTTRSQGTGVGLAVVKRIADAHGFSIQVLDNLDGGVTFRVDLGEARQVEPAPR